MTDGARSLQQLFEDDPLNLTSADIDAIITRMREARAAFELGGKAPVAAKPRKAAAGAPKMTAEEASNMLKDLGLD